MGTSNAYKNPYFLFILSIVLITFTFFSCTNKWKMFDMHEVSRDRYIKNLTLIEDCIKQWINADPYSMLIKEFELTTDSLKTDSYQELEGGRWMIGRWVADFNEGGVAEPIVSFQILYPSGEFQELVLKLQKTDNKYQVVDWDTVYVIGE